MMPVPPAPDLDMVSESSSDVKEITDFLDKQFAHGDNPGVKVIDKSEVLGVKRVVSSLNGTRRLQLHQDFKCQELWDTYGDVDQQLQASKKGEASCSHTPA
eukprot:COSAG06_NODE_27651_length_588_cov_0.810204_2_plen_100_part_01